MRPINWIVCPCPTVWLITSAERSKHADADSLAMRRTSCSPQAPYLMKMFRLSIVLLLSIAIVPACATKPPKRVDNACARYSCPSVMEIRLVGIYAERFWAWVSTIGNAVNEPPPRAGRRWVERSKRREWI